MSSSWLHQLYDEYRRGYPEAVAGVRALQRKVSIGCATPRDVGVLKGLDEIRVGQEQASVSSGPFVSDETLRLLLDLIVQARRPASVNRLTAGTSPLRLTAPLRHQGGQRGEAAIAGAYDGDPFFGGSAFSQFGGGHGGGGHGGGGHGGGGHGFHPGGHGHGFRRGGGGVWFGPWGGWPDDCYADAYGRIWCWTPYGWRVMS